MADSALTAGDLIAIKDEKRQAREELYDRIKGTKHTIGVLKYAVKVNRPEGTISLVGKKDHHSLEWFDIPAAGTIPLDGFTNIKATNIQGITLG